MDVAAILCIRDDAPYVANCLTHLVENGIDYAVIDNDSRDDLQSILCEPRFKSHLVDYSKLPFTGSFDLARQLEAKETVAARLGADWIIHHDVDEVMHANEQGRTLLDAIAAADGDGRNTVDFDEFVFLPVECDYVPDHAGWQPLRHYYFFRPRSHHLMRARKARAGLSLADDSGGHVIRGRRVRVAPERLVLRHYIFRSRAHAREKHPARRYRAPELAQEWHHDRAGQRPEAFRLPPAAALKRLRTPSDRDLDRTDPKRSHYWQWPSR